MDQDTARRLFEQGACLVILDAPTGTEFGIDLDTWETGPLFSGLKMIPPGMHYIHYSAKDSAHGATSMRSGRFRAFEAQEVVVWRWDAATEQLVEDSRETVERIRANLRDLDPRLGAYPVGIARDGEPLGTSYTRWTRISCYVSASTVARVLPAGGSFSSATGSVYEDEEMQQARKKLTAANEPFMENSIPVDAADRFAFPLVDIRHSFPRNAAPEDIHKYIVDKTWLLREMLRREWDGRAELLLGEFQVAFLVVLVGQNFAGLEHWKRLMHLVLGSSSALEDRDLVARLVVPLLHTMRGQLDECPADFASM
ncbi:hypothetical protein GGI23_006916, partial [Coemansia sp. RSA 2559]